jgi:hypothetical protein
MEQTLKSKKLIEDLEEIRMTTVNVVKQAELSIILCRDLLTIYKTEIKKEGFKDEKSEIAFFKIYQGYCFANLRLCSSG